LGHGYQRLRRLPSRGDRLNQAVVLSNLALAYQQLGQWIEGNQAIADGIEILNIEQAKAGTNEASALLAQAFNIRGSLQLAQGQAEPALLSWQMATAAYQRLKQPSGMIRSQINQSQALRALGLYPRAKSVLEQVNQTLTTQPDSLLKAAGLVNYGDAMRCVWRVSWQKPKKYCTTVWRSPSGYNRLLTSP